LKFVDLEVRDVKFVDLLKFVGLLAAVAAVALLVARILFFEVYVTNSESMLPTIGPDDRVLVRTGADPTPGDVVVVTVTASPGPSLDVLKRVIAVGPDRVDFIDGQVLVNGERLDEPYVAQPGMTFPISGDAIRRCDVSAANFCVLAEGTVFLLGDNRQASTDSRIYGPVDRAQVQGVVRWDF